MKKFIPKIYNTSIPCREYSPAIRKLANQWICGILLDRLRQCQSVIGLDICDLLEFIEDVSLDEKWSPRIFLATHLLARKMKKGDVTDILDSIQEIQGISKSGIISSHCAKVSSILLEPWEEKYISLLRKYDQKNIRGECTIVRPIINSSEMNFHKKNIREAVALIKLYDDDLFSEIEELVTDIKLFQGRVLRGDTSTYTFGSMWLRVPEREDDQVGYWIEHVVHETSHLRFVVHFFYEQLVLNPISERKFKAPIRDDLRPMYGVFHACFVLARMIRIFKTLSMQGFDKRFRDRLQLCRLQFEKGLETIFSPEASLTETGKQIRESLNACANNVG